MNKNIRILLVSMFAFILVFMAGSSTVYAYDWAAPWTVPVSGDMVFTSTAVSPLSLAGAEKTDGGLIVPVGFPTGEKQFGGQALQVSGLSSGSASACFSFPTYRYGWRGGVYQWLNNKWVSMPTTFSNTADKEGAPTLACATIYSSGTYALLTHFSIAEAPVKSIPECDFIDRIHIMIAHPADWPANSNGINSVDIFPALPAGTRVDYKIMNISPAGALTGSLSASSTATRDGAAPGDPYSYTPFVWDQSQFYFTGNWDDISFTLRVYTMGCYKDAPWPEVH